MNYLGLFYRDANEPPVLPGTAEFDALAAAYGSFFESAGDAVVANAALQPASTAATIRHDGGAPLVTDGPYTETAEVAVGFCVLSTENLDEAIELARRIPAAGDGAVELRPMVDFSTAGEIDRDWWLAMLLEPSGDAVIPGSEEWDRCDVRHAEFGKSAGDAVRGGGALYPPDSATTVRVREGEVLLTDGPFAESAELASGIYFLDAPVRATAVALAAKIPVGPKGCVEVRQLMRTRD
ncbi:transcription initiation protein [Rhodococcus spelaei]|uniref:Transcription initiation protein n=1 Tax=Rhodococcus spelaei TaxID=2546320 RepID=A0A541BRT9_9NOCA|nr:YciI family protein [Rhodococcus spelaei]TQF75008.1 transcription initiation protein [Rhodococcus spelaei]